MKTITFFLAAAIISLTACKQATPPNAVSGAFQKKFTGAKYVKWSHENQEGWEAEFVFDGNKMSAVFDGTGNWKETETELKKNDLPASVMKTINEHFSGYKVNEPERVEKPGFSGYEAELEQGEETLEVLFTSDGQIQSKKTVEEGDEDKD